MRHVRSADGTKIAYEKTGQGLPLIIIGGALGNHRFYLPLADELAEHFTVYTYDRRGRGQSGDTQPYSVERELDDLAALIAEAGPPALVYGHSAGSALALRAAAAALDIAKLILADPPYSRHSDADDAARARQAETAAKLQAFHDKGDHKGAAALFLSGFGLPSQEIDELLGSPAGEAMIDSARALPYDYAVVGDGLLPDELAAQAAVPALVLAAGTAVNTARALVEEMPHATLRSMKASTHDLPPDEIASAVTPFFSQER
jgi:pimeloyl-ACP methyl ester carboxylesterase